MDKASGVVESKSRKGNSIKVGGEWYSVYSADDLSHVNWKDTVEFLYIIKDGKYRNIKGRVEVTGKGESTSGSTAKQGGYSNIGVELGHASNLAMRVMEQRMKLVDIDEPGSKGYWKEFIEQTETIYTIMKGIRAKHESAPEVVKVEKKAEPMKDLDDDDIF